MRWRTDRTAGAGHTARFTATLTMTRTEAPPQAIQPATDPATDPTAHVATAPAVTPTTGQTRVRPMRHQGYELLCGAAPDDRGRFRATLVITRDVWPTRPRTIAVAQDAYLDPDDAIQAAQAQGLAWIANYG